jgi:hypothetical protein
MGDVRRQGIPNPSGKLRLAEDLSAAFASYLRKKGTMPEGWGFAIFMFDYHGPESTWISSAKRVDMVKFLREMADKLELDAAGGPVAPFSN